MLTNLRWGGRTQQSHKSDISKIDNRLLLQKMSFCNFSCTPPWHISDSKNYSGWNWTMNCTCLSTCLLFLFLTCKNVWFHEISFFWEDVHSSWKPWNKEWTSPVLCQTRLKESCLICTPACWGLLLFPKTPPSYPSWGSCCFWPLRAFIGFWLLVCSSWAHFARKSILPWAKSTLLCKHLIVSLKISFVRFGSKSTLIPVLALQKTIWGRIIVVAEAQFLSMEGIYSFWSKMVPKPGEMSCLWNVPWCQS